MLRVPEEELSDGGPEETRRLDIVDHAPVTGDQTVSWIPKEEEGVSDPGGQRLAEVDETGRLAVQPDGVDPVAVEVADERLVPYVAEEIGEIGGSEAPLVGAQLVDDVDPTLRWAVDRNAVTPVAVEVAGERYVRRVAEEESDVGHPLGVGVAQVDESVRLAIETGRVDAVTVPVADHREITGVPIQEVVQHAAGAAKTPHPCGRIDKTHPVGNGVVVDGLRTEIRLRLGSGYRHPNKNGDQCGRQQKNRLSHLVPPSTLATSDTRNVTSL